MREIKRARERARERETERQRQRDREAETEKQRDVETDRQQDRPPPSVSVSVCRCVRSEVERLAARGEAAPVPVLLGTNRDEGTTFCHLVRRPPRACPPPARTAPSPLRSIARSLVRCGAVAGMVRMRMWLMVRVRLLVLGAGCSRGRRIPQSMSATWTTWSAQSTLRTSFKREDCPAQQFMQELPERLESQLRFLVRNSTSLWHSVNATNLRGFVPGM